MFEPATPEPESRPGFFQSIPPLQLILLGISLVFLQQLVLGSLGPVSPNLYLTLLGSALLVFWALPIWLLRRAEAPVVDTLRFHAVSVPQIGWTLLGAVALVLPVNLLGEWNLGWLPPPERFEEFLTGLTPQSPGAWVLAAVSVCLVVPIGEEIVFRGIMQQAARQGLRGPAAAILVGILFAVLHFEPWYILGLSLMGIGMGLAMEITGSLWAAILVHGVYNTVALVALAIPDERIPTWIGSSPTGIVTAAGSAVVAVLAMRGLRSVSNPPEDWAD